LCELSLLSSTDSTNTIFIIPQPNDLISFGSCFVHKGKGVGGKSLFFGYPKRPLTLPLSQLSRQTFSSLTRTQHRSNFFPFCRASFSACSKVLVAAQTYFFSMSKSRQGKMPRFVFFHHVTCKVQHINSKQRRSIKTCMIPCH
jgi:hypothetical protein